MSDDYLKKFADLYEKFGYSPNLPETNLFSNSIVSQIRTTPPKIEIDEESTFAYQMQQQTNQIIEKNNELIKVLEDQNNQLTKNNTRLEEILKLKETELSEAKLEAKKSKKYNFIMLIIAVVSMLVAIASWLIPDLF